MNKTKPSVANDMRKQLKVKILQLKADELQKKINDCMSNVEDMTNKYVDIMAELHELNGVKHEQSQEHMKLLSRMTGKKTPANYSECKTSEEMLQLVMDELNQVKEMEKRKNGNEDQLPDVGDNSEIWERIAKAQKDAEERNALTESPISVVKETQSPSDSDSLYSLSDDSENSMDALPKCS